MAFEERFQLLMASGQANSRSVAATRRALAGVEARYGIPLAEQSAGAALASHLAITMKRLLDGEALTPAPDALWEELQDYPEEVALAAALAGELEQDLGLPVGRDEVGFIALHLCRIRIESGAGTTAEAQP